MKLYRLSLASGRDAAFFTPRRGEGVPITDLDERNDALVGDRIASIPELVSGFVAGSISVFQ
jgi:hypothetical protein